MDVITLTNEKGGVGKTTLAIHVAAGLALEDKRVLLIDADAQGHCAKMLKMPKTSGLYDLLVRDAEWNDVVVVPPFAAWGGMLPTTGNLMVLPSNEETRVIPLMINNPLALRERLEELAGAVDVVVIDTSPTPSLMHTVVYMATDFVLYPTECEDLSLDGLNGATAHMEKQNQARASFGITERARIMGVIPTMYTNTLAHQYGLDLLEKHFAQRYGNINMVWQPIPQRTIWREAAFAHKTVFAYAPESSTTQETAAMVERVAQYVA